MCINRNFSELSSDEKLNDLEFFSLNIIHIIERGPRPAVVLFDSFRDT